MKQLSARLAAAALSLALLTATAAGCTGNMAGRVGAGGGGTALERMRMDLGMQVSSFVAGLSVMNGGTAGTTGPARTGAGGGGVAGPGGSPAGIGMTHTAGAAGSPAGAGSATGAATPGAGGGGGRGTTVGVSTIIVGNVAFIGIDPATMVITGGGTVTDTTGDLSTYIRSRVITQFPQLADVFVTTDKAQVSRIARIHGDMLSGMPATRMLPEILTVVRTLAPTSGTTGTTGVR